MTELFHRCCVVLLYLEALKLLTFLYAAVIGQCYTFSSIYLYIYYLYNKKKRKVAPKGVYI